jgi:hypothetical protein
MKTIKLFIAFRAVTTFKVRFKSTASRACHRAIEWQAAPDVITSLGRNRWPFKKETRLERGASPNQVEINIGDCSADVLTNQKISLA